MNASVKSFPTLYRACCAVAGELKQRMTTDDFAAYVKRYPRDALHKVEARLAAMPVEARNALMRQMMIY